MTIITLKIDEKNATGKNILNLLQSLSNEQLITIIDNKQNQKKNISEIEESLDDIKNGRVTKYKSVDSFFKTIT